MNKKEISLKAFIRAKDVLCIDIGDAVLKLMELDFSSDKPCVASIHVISFPDEIVREKEKTKRKELIINFLKEAIADKGISAKHVVYYISGGSVFSRKIQVPKLSPKEKEEGIRWEASNQIPFNLDDSYFDWYYLREVKLNDNTVNDEYMIAASSKKMVDDILDIIIGIDKEPYCIGIPICGIHNLIKELPQFTGNDIIAVVDVGAKRTNIVIVSSRCIVFSREIPIGDESISELLFNEFKSDMSFSEIKEISRKHDILTYCLKDEHTIDDEVLKSIIRVIRPLVEKILSEIKRSFDYYREQSSGNKIDKVILSGKTALTEGFDRVLAKVFNMPVENMDISSLLVLNSRVSEKEFHENIFDFITIIGLAIGHGEQINFVPKRYRNKKIKFLQLLAVAVVFTVLMAVLSFLIFSANVKFNKIKKEIEISNSKTAVILPKVQQFNVKCDEYKKNKKYVDLLKSRQLLLEKALKELSIIVPRSVTFKKLILLEDGWIRIEGYVFDDAVTDLSSEAVITDFIIEIENSPYFSEVKLEESVKGTSFEVPHSEFKIMCKVLSRREFKEKN